jgi:hypothetical protein
MKKYIKIKIALNIRICMIKENLYLHERKYIKNLSEKTLSKSLTIFTISKEIYKIM